MYPHRIRLRGPWTCEPLWRWQDEQTKTADLPPPFRMTMPGRWSDAGLVDFRGLVRCVRRFGYPGRIDEWEHVWLTFAGVEGRATAVLNGQQLGQFAQPAEFDVTTLLETRNTLAVDVDSRDPGGGLWGEVALEVRASAYLRGVRFWQEGIRLHAAGSVVGTSTQPLELYLFAAGQFLTHSLIEPAAEGHAFELSSDWPGVPAAGAIPVRVELVNVAIIWYVVEGSVQPGQSKAPPDSSYR